MDDKLGEIQTSPKYKSRVSRNFIGFDPADVLFATRKSSKTETTDYDVSKKKSLYNKGGHEDTRTYDILHSKRTVESKSHQSPSKLGFDLLGQKSPTLESESSDIECSQAIPGVVDKYFKPGKRSVMASLASDKHPDGRKSVRLGSRHSRATHSGAMAIDSQIPFLELSRIKSCPGDLESQRSEPEGQTYKNLLRQHHHSGVSPSSRGYQESRSPQSLRQNICLGRSQHLLSLSHPSKGRKELNSRLSKSSDYRPQRVVLERKHLSTSHTKMGTTSDRSLCLQQEYKGSPFLLSGTKYSVLPEGCLQSDLERSSNVRFSSYTSHSESGSKDQRRPSEGYSRGSLVAKEELVSVAREDGIRRTCHAGTSKQSVIPGSSLPSKPTGSPALGVDPERKLLIAKGLSNKVISTLKASRKPVTHKIYARIWGKFVSFCGRTPPNQLSPNISQVLDFLQAGFDKGLKTSSLKVQISALSAFFDTSLAENRWIQRTQSMPKNRSGIHWMSEDTCYIISKRPNPGERTTTFSYNLEEKTKAEKLQKHPSPDGSERSSKKLMTPTTWTSQGLLGPTRPEGWQPPGRRNVGPH
ncbi:hypothetical protein GDO81_009634 [Engystomops pustulosus]|uniref:Core-binding (CB) domain-containing protein n=1 Tax=Engystomops pustulosus TaxID=76066 RepID=A0AAV7BTB2_ENGPU|nr:hypothetical protein GDO81_009634 [Engystomops pustulosus]